ncbi:MAG: hypothetical protein RLZZ28_2717 [Bacteroidota bacterium]
MAAQFWITGFFLGIVSSFHCVGMCGPLVLAMPVHYLPQQLKTTGIILYHLSRITVYAFMGFLFGLLGRQVYLAGWQQGFSILLGAVLVLTFLYAFSSGSFRQYASANRFTTALKKFIAAYMKQKKLYGMIILGAANGLLPCGMVYFAITGAMATGFIWGGVGFMAAFGLGTFPAMFVLTYFGSSFSLSVRNKIKKAVPYIALLVGILLILRGLNLNIPYISPYLQSGNFRAIDCH